MSAVDVDFKHAVFAAARQRDSGRLVEFLRSDRPIGRGERDMLADLVAGDLARPRGNPHRVKAEQAARRKQAVSELAKIKKEHKTKGLPRLLHDEAVAKVAEDLNVIPSQLDDWYRNPKRRG